MPDWLVWIGVALFGAMPIAAIIYTTGYMLGWWGPDADLARRLSGKERPDDSDTPDWR